MNKSKGVDVAPILQERWHRKSELKFEGGEKERVEVTVTLLHCDYKPATEKQLKFLHTRRLCCYGHDWIHLISSSAASFLIKSSLEFDHITLRLHF